MTYDRDLFAKELKSYFVKKILPFWKNLKDDGFGGYYGMLDFNLKLDKKAAKGCILNSRILWFFSNAYLEGYGADLLLYADHAFAFLKNDCIDKDKGGAYWSLNYDGTPNESVKYTYSQAYCLYALSSYYEASKNAEALELAYQIYHIIEDKCTDNIGYVEAFTDDWKPIQNDKLSGKGIVAEKTMNTYLHIIEAYTEFYRVTKDAEIASKLRSAIDKFAEKIYNSVLRREEVFFDREFHSMIDLHSYGHDIEASWLIDRALNVLNDATYRDRIGIIATNLAEEVFKDAYREHSLVAECESGIVNTKRGWWCQCEAMIGFYNEYQKSGREEFAEASYQIWQYIFTYIDDKREGSEWYAEVDALGNPNTEKPIVDEWKCPYHVGRLFFEMINRLTSTTK